MVAMKNRQPPRHSVSQRRIEKSACRFSLLIMNRTCSRNEASSWMLAGYVTADPFLQLTIRRDATFLTALYSNESSPQRKARGTNNGCTSNTQCT